jgi:hypothetical protein
MGSRGIGVIFFAVGLLASTATADEVSLRVGGGYLDLVHARASARAVFDDATGGGTARMGIRWLFTRTAYVEVSGQYFKKTGHQAFACDRSGNCFPGVAPLSLRLVPLYAMLGVQAAAGAVRPYVALGIGALFYHEEDASFDNPTTDVRATYRGEVGVDFGKGPLRLGLAASFATAPGDVGLFQTADLYQERNFGDLSVLGQIIVRMK